MLNSALEQSLIYSCITLATLTFVVAFRMFYVRVSEMKQERIHPQSINQSFIRSQTMKDSRASDNYNHLFEMPVLFYVLCGLSIASQSVPEWLPVAAWIYVALRVLHSWIQCTYNKVMHRFTVFCLSYGLLWGMWIGFLIHSI